MLGYETFGLLEPLGAPGYETFGRPKRPATLGYETFGRPERPARLGYETFDCGAPLTWREAPCRFHVMRAARALPTEIRTDKARGVKAVSVFVLSLGHTVHVWWFGVRWCPPPLGGQKSRTLVPFLAPGDQKSRTLVLFLAPGGYKAPGGKKSRTLVLFLPPGGQKSR